MALTDWQRIEDLATEIGTEAVVEVVAMFLEETDEVMSRLSSAAPTTEDYHFLKGSALNLGLTDFAALCEQGEQETRTGTSNPQTHAAITAHYPVAKAALIKAVAARFGT
jgi:histidine phosphotransfer protein HptB